ncbi:MAG: hypothetical protein AB1597_08480 [Chloroflexota bacterium]
MSFIRSAREIAAEKVEKIGRLSEDEQRRLKEQEIGQAGVALAEKYLGSSDERVLEDAFERYGVEERKLLGKAVLEWLLQTVELRPPGRLDTVIRGIASLPGTEKLGPGIVRLRDVFAHYQTAENDIRGQIDREGKEALHRLRISGTAVGEINIRARPEWEQKVKGLSEPYIQELEAVKKELLSAAG